jgi:hypothetical protein
MCDCSDRCEKCGAPVCPRCGKYEPPVVVQPYYPWYPYVTPWYYYTTPTYYGNISGGCDTVTVTGCDETNSAQWSFTGGSNGPPVRRSDNG